MWIVLIYVNEGPCYPSSCLLWNRCNVTIYKTHASFLINNWRSARPLQTITPSCYNACELRCSGWRARLGKIWYKFPKGGLHSEKRLFQTLVVGMAHFIWTLINRLFCYKAISNTKEYYLLEYDDAQPGKNLPMFWGNVPPPSYLLTYGAEPFLRSCQLCSYSRTSQHFMEPCSQESSAGPYPEPDRSSPYNPILSKIYFDIVHPPTSWSS
jgi:hypothetical protein